MMKIKLLTALLAFTCYTALADDDIHGSQIYEQIIFNGDTMAFAQLESITIVENRFEDELDELQFNIAVNRIRKVYPLVVKFNNLVQDSYQAQQELSGSQFRKWKKEREQELSAELEHALKKMGTGSGRTLVKLINRETDNQFYEILKDLKGGANAFIYQKLAVKNGFDLKDRYVFEDEKRIESAISYLKSKGELTELSASKK